MPQTIALNQRLGGTNFIYVNGQMFLLTGELEWAISTPTRETQSGNDGVHGYTEKPGPGHIKAKLRDYAGNSVTSVGDMTAVAVSVQLANGKTISGSNMWVTERPAVSGEDGSFEVMFEGGNVQEFGP